MAGSAMTQYAVFGADDREYGPAAEEQVRRWIAEGRVAADSQARTGDADRWDSWRPLGSFGEFAADFEGLRRTPPDPRLGDPPVAFDPSCSRVVAGLLGIFLGAFGVHRFYLGFHWVAVIQIAVTVVTFGIGAWWGIIEGILILARLGITKDALGRPLRD
jgi:TM2 domain-containing membrane protein YozV